MIPACCFFAVVFVPALLIVMIFGAVTGFINSFFVNYMKFVPFISSLAVSIIYGRVALIVTKAANIPISNESFLLLGSTNIWIFPLPFFLAIVLMVIYGVIMAKTGFGRRVYMTGGHANAARLTGINQKKSRQSSS